MILTRNVIIAALDSGDMAIEPYTDTALESASYNVALHNQIRVFMEGLNEIDVAAVADDVNVFVNMTRIIDMNINGYYLLKPGELVLGMTEEKVRLPRDVAGWIQGRSRFARMGLMVHITASFMQPGSNNRLVFEIYNASRNAIKLRPAIPIAQIIFERCEGSAEYDGSFKDQDTI
ncbi:MAG TPA: dCTP deaminase [Candidatus Lokiarchaeia archaeon]|nr:dCTP deaminase [Candidatus Lokiarchaeia archaeon]